MHKQLALIVAALSLVVCLVAPVLFFLGRISLNGYKLAFLVASAVWFVFATWGTAGKRAAPPREA